jgi:hypothetical protein
MKPRRLPVIALALVALGLPAPSAVAKGKAGGPGAAPITLPGEARAAAVRHTGSTWIVGGQPGAATTAAARRFGARGIVPEEGVYVVPIARARAFAAALGSRLKLAEPDAIGSKTAFPQDPLTPSQAWIPSVVNLGLTPPPVTGSSPVLGIIEEEADPTHCDMQGVVQSHPLGLRPPPDAHGTEVAAVAGAPANGCGTVGIWPGLRQTIHLYRGVTCSTITDAVNRAVRAGVRVINMSYGFQGPSIARLPCRAHLIATQTAFGRGVSLVAAGGNEFAEGNPLSRPGADPHIISVAALNRDDSSAVFSNEHVGMDVSAPGTQILTATPPQFDDDPNFPPGFGETQGTSFSSPIVAAAVTWLRAVRRGLSASQAQFAVQRAALDLIAGCPRGRRGWDRCFGYGKLNMQRLLAVRTPPHDPLEPNDDAEWVDGRRFSPDPPIFTGARRLLNATLQSFDDEFDVYRAVLPRRSRVRFTAIVLRGDVDLDVYRAGVSTVTGVAGRIGSSQRVGRRTETVTISNSGPVPRTVLVNPYTGSAAREFAYRLVISRVG